MVVPAARAAHVEPGDNPVPASVEFHKQKNFLALYLLHARLAVLPEFILRYGIICLARDAFRSPRVAWARLRGWCHTLARLPWLIADRRRLGRSARAATP